jgi:hypothetical protein
MKFLKYFLALLAVLCAFLIGLVLFAPWQTLAVYGLDSFRLDAAKNGVYVSYENLDTSGALSPTYSMRAFDVETPMALVSLTGVRVEILPISSLMSSGAVCRVYFSGGTITLVPNTKLELSDGHVKLAMTRETLRATDAQFSGDVQLAGNLIYDVGTKKIRESSIAFSVPEEINAMLKNPIMARFVESNENGEWRIRYEAQNK